MRVVPISSQTGRLYPTEAIVTITGERRKAMADQIVTASQLRLREMQGQISGQDMARLSGSSGFGW